MGIGKTKRGITDTLEARKAAKRKILNIKKEKESREQIARTQENQVNQLRKNFLVGLNDIQKREFETLENSKRNMIGQEQTDAFDELHKQFLDGLNDIQKREFEALENSKRNIVDQEQTDAFDELHNQFLDGLNDIQKKEFDAIENKNRNVIEQKLTAAFGELQNQFSDGLNDIQSKKNEALEQEGKELETALQKINEENPGIKDILTTQMIKDIRIDHAHLKPDEIIDIMKGVKAPEEKDSLRTSLDGTIAPRSLASFSPNPLNLSDGRYLAQSEEKADYVDTKLGKIHVHINGNTEQGTIANMFVTFEDLPGTRNGGKQKVMIEGTDYNNPKPLGAGITKAHLDYAVQLLKQLNKDTKPLSEEDIIKYQFANLQRAAEQKKSTKLLQEAETHFSIAERGKIAIIRRNREIKDRTKYPIAETYFAIIQRKNGEITQEQLTQVTGGLTDIDIENIMLKTPDKN